MRSSRISKSEVLDIYLESDNQLVGKLLSMVDRISDHYSLTYGDDYEVRTENEDIMISFYKYYNSSTDTAAYVVYSKEFNDFSVITESDEFLTDISTTSIESYFLKYYSR
jgi:hypothetical protein